MLAVGEQREVGREGWRPVGGRRYQLSQADLEFRLAVAAPRDAEYATNAMSRGGRDRGASTRYPIL